MARDSKRRLLPDTPREIAQAVKVIRKYADGFGAKDGYDLRALSKQGRKVLTKSRRQKLYRYFNIIAELEARPHQVIKPRNKKRLRALQEFSRHRDFPRDLKVAFYPTTGKVKIDWRGNRPVQAVRLDTGEIIKSLFFDQKKLATNPEREIANTLDKAPDDSLFYVMAGENLIWNKVFDKSGVTRELLLLMERYGSEHENPNNPASSHYGNWLLGLEVQPSISYMADRDKRRRDALYREDFQQVRKIIRDDTRSKTGIKKSKRAELKRRLQNVNLVRLEQGLPLYDIDDFI